MTAHRERGPSQRRNRTVLPPFPAPRTIDRRPSVSADPVDGAAAFLCSQRIAPACASADPAHPCTSSQTLLIQRLTLGYTRLSTPSARVPNTETNPSNQQRM